MTDPSKYKHIRVFVFFAVIGFALAYFALTALYPNNPAPVQNGRYASTPTLPPPTLLPPQYLVYVDVNQATQETYGAVQAAIAYWSAVGYDIRQVGNEGDANRIVQFIHEWGGDKLGQACVSTDATHPCLVQIGLGDSKCNNKWTPFDFATIKAIGIHEMGHGVGLEHSNDPNNPMYPAQDARYAAPCDITSGTASIPAGQWWGVGTTLPWTARLGYSLSERENGAVDVCIFLSSDYNNGYTGRGWACHQNMQQVSDAANLNAGSYTLGMRCDNIIDTCVVVYSLAYTR